MGILRNIATLGAAMLGIFVGLNCTPGKSQSTPEDFPAEHTTQHQICQSKLHNKGDVNFDS